MDRNESSVVKDTFVDINTSEFPILGDNVSPVTPYDHPSMRHNHHRISMYGGNKRKLAHSPLSQTQSSTSSMTTSRASLSLTDRLTLMNIPTQDLKGSVFYGWLWKRGHSFKTWKKRFFLLNGVALTYYKQCCVIASDVLGGGTQCLDLPIRGGLRVAKAEFSDMTTFGLKITSSSGRVLYAQAGDQASREQWLKVLEEAPLMRGMAETIRGTMVSELLTQSTDGGSPKMDTALSVLSSEDDDDAPSSDMQGYLYMRTGLFSTWKKRFMKLTNGQLTIRRNRTLRNSEPMEADKPLQVITAVRWNGHSHGLCIRLENRKELFVYADHDADATMWLNALKNC
ncbi:dynein light chain [Plasmopara halstedii]|uniref:Dynein light chain n=1 Tax=Plasmopara halstedii TaxID=4781 RepID=A0A0P1ALC5_PLAHL|nr:dynein light chain [Plasmopara halstedii]CEG42209.1 dynein light chain [Plasmopara halstedii]|eukprot:XP_024578578.1 dynein light chain [Plasmopara halstedii]